MRRYAAAAAAVLLTVSLAACAVEDEPAEPSSSASESGRPTDDGDPTGSARPTDSADSSASDSPSDATSAGELPSPGTAQAPAAVTAATAPMAWREQGDGPETVVSGTTYTIITSRDNRTVRIGAAGDLSSIKAPAGFHWNDALLDGRWAVVVAQHDRETEPSVATVVDLATGKRRSLDGRSQPATVNGGAWAIGEGRVFHATYGPKNAYCLAEVDLKTLAGQTTYCAEPRTGFTNVRVTPAGLSLMSFDSGKVSCRTVLGLGEAAMEPFAGAPRCRAWEGLSMPGGDAVFTVVGKEDRIELSDVVARVGDGYYSLGEATTGSLVWCDGAAYFSRDPQADTDPSRLLRWDGTRLTVVFEGGEGGDSALSAPRCGGDAITVSLLAESGDRQVTAPTD